MSPLNYIREFKHERRPKFERSRLEQVQKLYRRLQRAAEDFGAAWTEEKLPPFRSPTEALKGAATIQPGSPAFEKASPRLRRAVSQLHESQKACRAALEKGPICQ